MDEDDGDNEESEEKKSAENLGRLHFKLEYDFQSSEVSMKTKTHHW